MKNNILVALNDSITSRRVVEFLSNLSLNPDDVELTLLHVLRKQSSQEELMGKKFGERQAERMSDLLEKIRTQLLDIGFAEVKIELETKTILTVSDAIIEQFEKVGYSMLVIGRKHMSKSEEFILGDISVNLIRKLKGAAIVVVKPE